jgi:hypothetical protein
MAELGRTPHDWSRASKPTAFQLWIANHRRLLRAVLALIDLTIVVLVVSDVLDGGARWHVYAVVVAWGLLTLQFGWLMPRDVDRWPAAERETGA